MTSAWQMKAAELRAALDKPENREVRRLLVEVIRKCDSTQRENCKQALSGTSEDFQLGVSIGCKLNVMSTYRLNGVYVAEADISAITLLRGYDRDHVDVSAPACDHPTDA